jgi:outer membrane autotransporter protein
MPARAKSLAFARAAAGLIRLDFAPPLRRLSWAILLAALAPPGAALAQTAQCAPTTQPPTLCSDQANLLSPFGSLLNSSAGLAVLEANMQTEDDIYAGASAARMTLAAENALIDYAPQSILIGAFPNNPNFYFSAAGVPTAPALPTSVATAVSSVTNNMATGANSGDLKSYFGQINVYGDAYGNSSIGPNGADPLGDPRPFQTSSAIANNPFTPANSSLIAYEIQQTNFDNDQQNWQSYVQSPSFPSGHSTIGNVNAIVFAILAPGYYQQLLQSGVDFGYSRNVFGAHYPLDVIGGRILATYVTAETLAGDNPLYQTTGFNPGFTQANLLSLSAQMQNYLTLAGLGGGGASPYAAACANLAACLGNGTIPTAATYTQAAQNYAYYLTYNLPAVGPTNLAPVVPADAYVLIETRFPYFNPDQPYGLAQLDAILATTELPSGGALDNGSGWARLNLYAAAGGYGAFPSNVTVNMNAAAGGFNAFDVWSNDISGPGGLTLQGSGTLVLAGDDTFIGGVNVQGGALGVTGSLLGPLSVSPGATFVLGSTGAFTGVLTNDGNVDNEGVMTGTFAGSGAFANSGFLSGVGGFGSLDLLPGSTIALGNSIGAIQVAGDLTVAAGATYQAKVAGNSADQIEVGGNATLSGGAVVASVLGASAELGHAYPILVASGGVNGAFADVGADNLPFIQPSLSYDADDVFLTLARDGVPYASVATTPNQAAVADAIGAGPAGSGLDLALDVQSAAGAQRAFDALSGEVYASAETAMLSDSLYLREALLARMRQASFTGVDGPTAALTSGGPTTTAYADDLGSSPAASALTNAGGERLTISPGVPPAAVSATYSWIQAIDSWGRFGGDGDAAGASRTLGGFFAGVDRRFDSNWLAGVAGGYTDSSVSVSDRGSAADIGAAHLAGYVSASFGSWSLRSAASASFSALDARRSLAFPGFAETASAHYNAVTTQVFSEASYSMTLGKIAAEPFGGLAFAHLNVDGFAENGGDVAALSGSANHLDIGYSTLGARAAVDYLLANGMALTPRVSVAWQHAFGSLNPTETLTFQSTGETFAVAGLPIARDTALFEGGLDLRLSPRADVGLSYSGQYGDRVMSNSVKGNLTLLF